MVRRRVRGVRGVTGLEGMFPEEGMVALLWLGREFALNILRKKARMIQSATALRTTSARTGKDCMRDDEFLILHNHRDH